MEHARLWTRAFPVAVIVSALLMAAGCNLDPPPKGHGTAGNAAAVSPNEAIAQGRELIKLDRLDEAKALMSKVIEQDPSNAEAFMLRGIAYMRTGAVYPAVKDLAASVQIEPAADRYFNLGNALQQGGFNERAANAYRAALEMKADDPEVLNNLGSALLLQARWGEAQQVLERAAQLRPNDPEAYTNLGICFERQQLYDQAERQFFKAIEADPNYFPAVFNLAKTYENMKDPKSAADQYRRYLEIRPDAPDRGKIENRIWKLDPQI